MPQARSIKFYFTMQYETKPGEDLYILGDIQEFGNWDIDKGYKLNWHQNHEWSNVIQLQYEENKIVEYKYVVYNSKENNIKWEEGNNRMLTFQNIKESKNEVFLREIWEHRIIKLSLKHDCQNKKIVSVCINMPELETSWRNPITMIKYINPIDKNEYWKKEICIKHDIDNFRYKYILTNINDGKQIWERNSNRKCDLELATKKLMNNQYLFNSDSYQKKLNKYLNPNSSEQIYKKNKIYAQHHGILDIERKHNTFKKIDSNFQDKLVYNKINDEIYIGPYIQSENDIDDLAKLGIKAVLSLQTNADMRRRYVDWNQMKESYKRQGIAPINFQIIDMCDEDMARKAYKASAILKDLIDTYNKVYVHCTSGIGRAPQTVVSYFIFHKKFNIDEAVAFVKAKRSKALINKNLYNNNNIETIRKAYDQYKDSADINFHGLIKKYPII